MPIQVTCPGCKASFTVSDKFAGKKGPCPKCKAPITIPAAATSASGAAAPEVKIHGPDETGPDKTTTATTSLKPILRKESKTPVWVWIVAGVGVLAVIAAAILAAELLRESFLLTMLGVFVLALPSVIIGYRVLRNDELEPHTGAALWIRSAICAVGYGLLSVAFMFVPPDWIDGTYALLFLAIPFFLAGAALGFLCFDLEFGNGFLLYAFYVIIVLFLGWLADYPDMPWSRLGQALGF